MVYLRTQKLKKQRSKAHYEVRGGASPPPSNRKTTDNYSHTGNASAGARTRQTTSYVSGYNQRNNDVKSSTIDGRLVPGNIKLVNNDLNIRNKDKHVSFKNDRAVVGKMPGQAPDMEHMGRLAGSENALYSNIQMDRNSGDITEMLKSNPYVTDYKTAL